MPSVLRLSAAPEKAASKGYQIFRTCLSSKHPIELAWLQGGVLESPCLADGVGFKYQICT